MVNESTNKNKLRAQFTERHTQLQTHLRRNWINVLLQGEVAILLNDKCQDEEYRNDIIIKDEKSPIGSNNQQDIRLKGRNLLEFTHSSTGAGNEWVFMWSFVSSITLFEAFVNDIAKMAYLNNPEKFLCSKNEENTDSKENQKVINLLVKSESKEEALEKYVEERLRGIFYGNPTDCLVIYNNKAEAKDGKLKLATGEILDSNCKNELLQYREMVGRRNVIIHYMGKVDRKYVRDVPNTPYKLNEGDKITIDKEYLFVALETLDKLAATFIKQVCHSTCSVVT